MLYHKHVFICTNQRKPGERVCCGEQHGLELVAAFKKEILDKKLSVKIRAQRTGCFDFCEKGPMAVVYPDGIFYGNVQIADVKEIVDEHLANNKPVERLIIK